MSNSNIDQHEPVGYNVMLDSPDARGGIRYIGGNSLGDIAGWVDYSTKQPEQALITVQLDLDTTTRRILPMAYLIDNSETTLDELFSEQTTE